MPLLFNGRNRRVDQKDRIGYTESKHTQDYSREYLEVLVVSSDHFATVITVPDTIINNVPVLKHLAIS